MLLHSFSLGWDYNARWWSLVWEKHFLWVRNEAKIKFAIQMRFEHTVREKRNDDENGITRGGVVRATLMYQLRSALAWSRGTVSNPASRANKGDLWTAAWVATFNDNRAQGNIFAILERAGWEIYSYCSSSFRACTHSVASTVPFHCGEKSLEKRFPVIVRVSFKWLNSYRAERLFIVETQQKRAMNGNIFSLKFFWVSI